MRFVRKNNLLVLNLAANMVRESFSTELTALCADEDATKVFENEKCLIDKIKVTVSPEEAKVRIKSPYRAAFGLGERFDAVNQKGLSRTLEVVEKFCHQGPMTYCPIPFFFTDAGFGVYIETLRASQIDFGDEITITLAGKPEELPELVFFFGEPSKIISEFSQYTGKVKLPPKWSFGPWISANRWNTQKEVERQLMLMKEHQFPASVLVLEAWSDESTFYLWNGAAYKQNDGACGFSYESLLFDLSSFWEDPKAMIDKLHKEGLHLVLWQVPVIKKLEDGQLCEQHCRDWEYAVREGLVVLNDDGTPYTIPKGHWFSGSMLPDFTNPSTVKWWFGKRQYLLEIGVDGFKTDGGEFVYRDNIRFFNGATGKEMKNGFAQAYVKAYTEFIGPDRVLFSRAGYTGQQQCPIQWAGDQESTWDELRSILKAGLSIGLSGVPFWSFDIGGFAGALPSAELYERSTQLAVFSPVMQWHSEPSGGQFSEIMPSAGGINDRSPWNMAEFYQDKALLDRLRFHYNLRANLMPTLYYEAIKAQETGLPMMSHLCIKYPDDPLAYAIEDSFMLGDLLIAPLVYEGQIQREVYLPKGRWFSLWSGKAYEGGRWITSEIYENRIPVYIRSGCAIALNLGDSLKLGSAVGTGLTYRNLCFYTAGEEGSASFRDDHGNDLTFRWLGDEVKITRNNGDIPIRIINRFIYIS